MNKLAQPVAASLLLQLVGNFRTGNAVRIKASLCQHSGFPMSANGLNQREFVLHICFGAGLISV
jgi:hypothetical protein